jgi:hypothetical protein
MSRRDVYHVLVPGILDKTFKEEFKQYKIGKISELLG